ncbi:MAG: T9SS type A sorting domain-containing protein [Paludibacteraceae bacterium]|nr:T9SS type A sorting domain-containing protein [Paludibacteraceae bacterium]
MMLLLFDTILSGRRAALWVGLLLAGVLSLSGQTLLRVEDKAGWTGSALSGYVGQEVRLADEWYVTNNYNGYRVSPRRIYSATNQVLPGTTEYYGLLSLNSTGTVVLTGVSGYHRMGERLRNAVVKVNSTGQMTLLSGEWVGNTRADIEKGYDMAAIDRKGKHTLLVCGANLEYYLVENLGTGFGTDNNADHQAQRKKVSLALAKIDADVYGLVEIEMGQSALKEIAADLTKQTGRVYSYVDDGGVPNGSYTKSGYVYCTQTVTPIGEIRSNQSGVKNRKQMQCFEERATGERFVLSINHFKAKSGNGSGDNADSGDGQSSFNGDRVREAQSVVAEYESFRYFIDEEDMLVLGDLNAYAKEDPIRVLTDYGMTDLHRYFHKDSSYSYTYHGEAGYLDHALATSTMLPQVTGMTAYHINSDENDSFTYDKQDDGTMFRYSDHDPVLVGLNLLQTSRSGEAEVVSDASILFSEGYLSVDNAAGGYLRVYDAQGRLLHETAIASETYTLPVGEWKTGVYVIHVYANGQVVHRKAIVR